MPKQMKKQPKSAVVTRMLSRGTGATIAEIVKTTGWKEHSCRAFLSGIRKTSTMVKEQRADGSTAYRLEDPQPEKAAQ